MRLLMSGEGPTDLGVCTNGQGRCDGADYARGPMALLAAQLAEPKLFLDLWTDEDSWHFVSKTALCERAKAASRAHRLGRLRGRKQDAETRYYHDNAQSLAQVAAELAADGQDPVLPILFRDADGTRNHPADWSAKWQSMRDGFDGAGCPQGVPMLPMPKSEAWLLGLYSPGMANCKPLEALPGNDASPQSAKKQLAERMGTELSAAEWVDHLEAHPIGEADADRLGSMPSFQSFRQALHVALDTLLSRSSP